MASIRLAVGLVLLIAANIALGSINAIIACEWDLVKFRNGCIKGGVIALTKALALEFGALGMKTNILVNAVAPGPVDCGVTEHVSKEWRAAKEVTLPLGRYCDGDEVSPAVVFLASDDAGAFIGQVVCPNCGDTMCG